MSARNRERAQSRQQLENLRAQIDYDVRSALLDLSAANDQVQVARSALDLASQTLVQARDRFSAGVADNLEVIEAQDAVASANENYIGSLYAHNVAKVLLARAKACRQAIGSAGRERGLSRLHRA